MGVGRGVCPQLLGDRERARTTSTGRAARTAKRTRRARLGLRRSLGESSYLPLIRAGVVAPDKRGLSNKPTALAPRPVNHYRDPVHPRNVAGSHRKSLYRAQSKRKMMFLLVSEVLANGGTPQQVMEVIPRRKFKVFEGTLDAEQVKEQIMKDDGGGAVPRSKRFFCDEDEPFHVENKTYVLSNQWGNSTLDTAKSLAKMCPNLKIDYKQTM